ncbi:protoporphyrinogen oxidase, partial [Mycobacterium sp. ITM-2017-0098]
GDRPADHDVFRYPRLGPGQLWEAAAAELTQVGVTATVNSAVVVKCNDGRRWTVEFQDGQTVSGDAVFSSMPLRLLINSLEPEPPRHIR